MVEWFAREDLAHDRRGSLSEEGWFAKEVGSWLTIGEGLSQGGVVR